jgi:uncharacterized protein YhfF
VWPRIDGLRTMEIGNPGEMRARLNGLVLAGKKVATAGIVAEYDAEGEQVETVGEELVLVDDDTRPVGRITITRVEVVAFGEVSWEFAQSEGEGFTSIEDWRTRHGAYWLREGWILDDTTPIACIWFRLLGAGR